MRADHPSTSSTPCPRLKRQKENRAIEVILSSSPNWHSVRGEAMHKCAEQCMGMGLFVNYPSHMTIFFFV